MYAVWSANCIPVTFNMNYTDSLNPPQTVTLWKKADATGWYIDNACSASYSATANSSIILPGDVYFYDADSKEPYVFRGFYDKAHGDATNNTSIAVQYFMTDGTVSTDGANLTINSPITVYAAWATPCQAPLNGDTHYSATCKDGYTLSGYDTYTPSCTANAYTVKYNANGGSGTMSDQARKYNDNVALTANVFTRSGYTFKNWNTKTDGTGTTYTDKQVANLSSASGATVTLYAQWTACTYTVVYNSNKPSTATASISGTTANSTHTYDTAKALTTNGYKLTGWTFEGWSTSKTATTATYTDGQSVKNLTSTCGGTVNLYAVWSANCNKITVKPYCSGSTYNPPLYKKTDYTGWYSDSTCTTTTTLLSNVPASCNNSNGDFTLRGIYSAQTTTLSADGNTGIQYFTKSGDSTTIGMNWKVNGAKTIYLAWARDCVQPSNGKGTCELTVSDNGAVDYTTSCNSGYTISGNNTNAPVCTANPYSVTLDKNANDATAGTASVTATFDSAMPTPITLPTRAGYTFAGYYDTEAATGGTQYYTAAGASARSWNKASATTLYARWSKCAAGSYCPGDNTIVACPTDTEGRPLTSGAGSDAADDCYVTCASTISVDNAKTVSVVDGTPNYNGSVYPTCTYNVTCNTGYTVKNNKTATPSCTACTYSVKYNANGGSGTMSNSSHTYDTAKALTANAFTRSGYVFLGWSTSATGSVVHADKASVKNLTTTCGGTVTLYAIWEQVVCSATNAKCGTVTVTNNVPSVTITCDEGYSKTGTTDRTHSFTVTGSAGATSLSGSCSAQCNAVAIDPNGGVSGSITTLYKKTGSGTWYTNNTCTTSYSATKNVLPTRTGYTLRGLYDTKYADVDSDNSVGQRLIALSGNSGTLGNAWKITEDTSLYAAWAKNCLTPNNGTCSLTIKDYGYTDYKTTCNNGYSISGNNTNAPVCTANGYAVTLDKNASDATAGTSSVTATYDSAMPTPITLPTRAGYTFAGYYDTEATTGGTQYYTSAGASARTWDKAAATTLYARWKGNTITINYVENGGIELSNITCTYGESFKLPTISRSGYSFAGWVFGDTSSSESMTKLKAGATVICDYNNLKVYSGTADAQALWNIVGYAITYKDGDNEISGLTPTLYDVETEVNLPTVAYKEGKKFVSWHTDSALSESTVVNTIPKGSTGDKTFYVKWEDCPAGYACNGSSVTQCTGATYAMVGSASCSSCPSGYTYDTTKGKTKAEQCKIRCAGGSYLAKAKDASCTNVGAKYYKVAHIVNYNSASSRSACLTGLTTIGYGKGADEAGDCGRILHVDGETLYLRSAEKTDVSLHVKIGDAVFYGNMVVGTKKMSADATKTLKIKHNGQIYSVYDDSVN